MIHVAIVEDELQAAEKLTGYLHRLAEEADEHFEIEHFS